VRVVGRTSGKLTARAHRDQLRGARRLRDACATRARAATITSSVDGDQVLSDFHRYRGSTTS